MKTISLKKLNVLMRPDLCVLCAMLVLSSHAHSNETHSLDDISRTAHDFVLNQFQNPDEEIQIVVGQLDPRLNLHQCTIPLAAYNQNYESRQGLSTISVRCNDNKPWTLYVPVSVKNYKLVATLKHPAVRNTLLNDDDITFRKMNINRLTSGYFDDLNQIKGKILTQNLAKGAVLTQHHIKTPTAVNRGQSVTLIAKNPVIEVRMKGIAMSKGAIGDRIRVKNTKSKRIIEGIIVDKDLISVNL